MINYLFRSLRATTYLLRSYIRENKLLLLISISLFIVPFFWFKPGEMDLGGDGGRIYFYDPINLLRNTIIYFNFPMGTGRTESSFFSLPFVSVLAILKLIVGSPYVMISLHNGLKIALGFLSVYWIINELLFKEKNTRIKECAAIIGGLFYIFNPAMTENYVHALPTHDQVLLNPLLFLLLLKFLTSSDFRYAAGVLLLTLIFSHNFSFVGAPPFFAFFPSAIIFLLIYILIIKRKKLPWKKIILACILFLGLQAYQLLPEISNLFAADSHINLRLFDKEDMTEGAQVFLALLPIPKVSLRFLAQSSNSFLPQGLFIIPCIVMVAFLVKKTDKNILLLSGIFFLITLFLATANITHVGTLLYSKLFYIPGFSMFKNYYGQWQFSFYFYYAILFGQAVFFVSAWVKKVKARNTFFLLLGILLSVNAWNFLNGSLINQYNTQSTVKIALEMDPRFEETLNFIRSLSADGKFVIFPFTDSTHQVVYGKNGGAYVGTGMVGRLTGKNDFPGYMMMMPYSETFWHLSKDKKYNDIKKLFGLMNIRYILYNSDPRVYDANFPAYPYSLDYVRKYMPDVQEKYPEYIQNIANNKIYENGSYKVYEIDENEYVPLLYVPKEINIYKDNPSLNMYNRATAFFPNEKSINVRTSYISSTECTSVNIPYDCSNEGSLFYGAIPTITFSKINPTIYTINITNIKNPFILVFSNSFHTGWKLFPFSGKDEVTINHSYFDGEINEGMHDNKFINKEMISTIFQRPILDDKHFMINGYANAWYIIPSELDNKSEYTFIIEQTNQSFFHIGLLITGFSLVFLIYTHLTQVCSFLKRKS